MKEPNNLIITWQGMHNHSLESDHAKSFEKISPSTIETIYGHFDSKKNVKETLEILKKNQNACSPGRSLIPRIEDVYRLYYKWLNKNYGGENGPEMFRKLKEKADSYNGKVFFKW